MLRVRILSSTFDSNFGGYRKANFAQSQQYDSSGGATSTLSAFDLIQQFANPVNSVRAPL